MSIFIDKIWRDYGAFSTSELDSYKNGLTDCYANVFGNYTCFGDHFGQIGVFIDSIEHLISVMSCFDDMAIKKENGFENR